VGQVRSDAMQDDCDFSALRDSAIRWACTCVKTVASCPLSSP